MRGPIGHYGINQLVKIKPDQYLCRIEGASFVLMNWNIDITDRWWLRNVIQTDNDWCPSHYQLRWLNTILLSTVLIQWFYSQNGDSWRFLTMVKFGLTQLKETLITSKLVISTNLQIGWTVHQALARWYDPTVVYAPFTVYSLRRDWWNRKYWALGHRKLAVNWQV